MAVFRVERTKNYTVMSNLHLQNRRLCLNAKGLLSQMLSLPEDWDYTLAGLAAINPDGRDSIRSAVAELERAGYVVRSRRVDAQGRFAGNEYVIYESPPSPAPALAVKIGGTTYLVHVHFSETSKETLEDKIKRLLKAECGKL